MYNYDIDDVNRDIERKSADIDQLIIDMNNCREDIEWMKKCLTYCQVDLQKLIERRDLILSGANFYRPDLD